MAKKIIKVKKWIDLGELDDRCKDSEQILCDAAELMDTSCACEIVGSPLFLGKDGKHYVVEINAQIFEADACHRVAALRRPPGDRQTARGWSQMGRRLREVVDQEAPGARRGQLEEEV